MFICLLQAGYVVIADLSNPLLTSAEANSIFHVLLQQFTRLQGKQRAANGMLARGDARARHDCSGARFPITRMI